MNIRFYLVAVVLVVFLTGCGAAYGDMQVILAQSPVATPTFSDAVSANKQSLTAIPSSKVRTGEVTVLTMVGDAATQMPVDMFFHAALVNSKLYGIGKQASGQLALYEVDLKTGLTRQVGAARKRWGNMRASERYIVWDQDSDSSEYLEIHAYDLQTNQEFVLATHTAWPDVSGNIAVWGEVVYDLSKGAPIQIKNQHGKPHRPRISGKWIVYLDASSGEDTADIYAHNLTTDEDFKIGTMPLLGQRIGIVDWYPVISGKNIVWVSAQDDKLHHYNLDTRTDRLLPVPLTEEAALTMPRNLELDSDILVYDQRGRMGYDLALDVAFPIPVIPAVQGKWTSSTPTLVSGGRLVWQTSVDQETRIYITEIVRDK